MASNRGDTDLHNLVHLCPHHHKVVHEDGWEIEGDPNGTLVFRDKRGELLSSQLPPLSHRSKAMIDHFIVYEDEDGEGARDGP